MQHCRVSGVLPAFLLLAWAAAATAQQTIINVPSDALTPKGQGFALHESQFAPRSGEAIYTTTNFLTYGLLDHTELAATLYSIDSEGSPLGSLGLGFKTTLDVFRGALPALQTKWTGGFMLPLSPNQDDHPVGFFPYSHLTVQIPRTELRLLTGIAAGSKNLFGTNTLSALGGVEYPLTKHLSFTGEWFSGYHNLSGLIPGFTYHRKNLILVGGYKIPNDFEMRESGLVLEVGVFFGPGALSHDEDPMKHYGVREP
jgi:hypothetical protein